LGGRGGLHAEGGQGAAGGHLAWGHEEFKRRECVWLAGGGGNGLGGGRFCRFKRWEVKGSKGLGSAHPPRSEGNNSGGGEDFERGWGGGWGGFGGLGVSCFGFQGGGGCGGVLVWVLGGVGGSFFLGWGGFFGRSR